MTTIKKQSVTSIATGSDNREATQGVPHSNIDFNYDEIENFIQNSILYDFENTGYSGLQFFLGGGKVRNGASFTATTPFTLILPAGQPTAVCYVYVDVNGNYGYDLAGFVKGSIPLYVVTTASTITSVKDVRGLYDLKSLTVQGNTQGNIIVSDATGDFVDSGVPAFWVTGQYEQGVSVLNYELGYDRIKGATTHATQSFKVADREDETYAVWGQNNSSYDWTAPGNGFPAAGTVFNASATSVWPNWNTYSPYCYNNDTDYYYGVDYYGGWVFWDGVSLRPAEGVVHCGTSYGTMPDFHAPHAPHPEYFDYPPQTFVCMGADNSYTKFGAHKIHMNGLLIESSAYDWSDIYWDVDLSAWQDMGAYTGSGLTGWQPNYYTANNGYRWDRQAAPFKGLDAWYEIAAGGSTWGRGHLEGRMVYGGSGQLIFETRHITEGWSRLSYSSSYVHWDIYDANFISKTQSNFINKL